MFNKSRLDSREHLLHQSRDKSVKVWGVQTKEPRANHRFLSRNYHCIYKLFKFCLLHMWMIITTQNQKCLQHRADFFFGSCVPVAAPLMPVAIVSQFKRGKSTNQIKNRTQLANKSDCCAACQMNETARRSRSCEITPRISNSMHQIVSCYRTCRDTATWSSHVWKWFYSIMWYIPTDWLFRVHSLCI